DEAAEKKADTVTDTPLGRLRSGLGLQAPAAPGGEKPAPLRFGREQGLRMAPPPVPDLPPDPPLRAVRSTPEILQPTPTRQEPRPMSPKATAAPVEVLQEDDVEGPELIQPAPASPKNPYVPAAEMMNDAAARAAAGPDPRELKARAPMEAPK